MPNIFKNSKGSRSHGPDEAQKGSGVKRNIVFLGLTAMMMYMLAFSGVVNERSIEEAVVVEEVLPGSLSDDEIFFLRDTITKFLLARNFNGSVLAAREGTVLISRSFGFADFRNHTPLTIQTPFQLASISKTFTATAILMLHHDGRLHIDSMVTSYIPEFPYPDISVRMLLNHTAGLQNYMWLVERHWTQPYPPDNEDILNLFLRYPRHLDFRPGTRFAYSNTGYAFLGLLIERVSGQSFAGFMKENIFDPVGLKHTFVYDPRLPDEMNMDRAYGFRPWGRSHIVIPDVPHDGVMGDKGIFSNIPDLFLWDRAIAENRLLPEELWQEAFTHTRLANDRPVRYGLGWRLQSFLDIHVVHHPGRWSGFRTSLKRFTDKDATLIILSNNSRDITPLVEGLQNILFYREIRDISAPHEEDPEEYEVIGG